MTDHGVKSSKCGSLRVNISLTKSVSDYAHKSVASVPPVPVAIPIASPVLSVPTLSVHPELQPCVQFPSTPTVSTGVLLTERPEFLRRGSSRHFHMQQPYSGRIRMRIV